VIKNIINIINQAKIHAKMVKNMFIDEYLNTHLYKNNKYVSNPALLNNYEFSVYSQNGEDGILMEIFNRIGKTNNYFVEIGVQDGNECNSGLLLTSKWKGLWIEANKSHYKSITNQFSSFIKDANLQVVNNFVTAENIEDLFRGASVPKDFDLLSIDIDGNDYWIWKALASFRPRVVMIEYNAVFRPPLKWIMKYKQNHVWDKTNYYGASLEALSNLGKVMGYKLVCCDFTGTNAFFVADECINEKFYKPGYVDFHYHPQRYFLSAYSFYKSKNGPCVSE